MSPSTFIHKPLAGRQATVYVIDDSAETRNLLVLLGQSIKLKVQTFVSPLDFLAAYDGSRPGCIVLDLIMPDMSGLDALERFSHTGIDLPVIILTAHGDVSSAVRAMKAGAAEFIEKPASHQLLLERIQRCLTRDAERKENDATLTGLRQRFATLSRRELEVLEDIMKGHSSREIGERLGISTRTVGIHRSNLLKKTGARSTGHLIGMRFAVRP